MGRRRQKSAGAEEQLAPKPKTLTSAMIAKIEALAAEAAEANGLYLFDTEVGGRWLIQIYVERPNATPGNGVTVDECALVSRYVEGFLDLDEDVWPNYTIEVSSPGIERKLTKPRHYELSIGRKVRVVVHEPIGAQNVVEGTLVAFEDEKVTVQSEVDDVVVIEWRNIAKSRLVYDFSE